MEDCLENIISRTFEEVKNEICENYCRYPREWDEEKEGDADGANRSDYEPDK